MKKFFSIALVFCLFAAISFPAAAVEVKEKASLSAAVHEVSSVLEEQTARVIVTSGVQALVEQKRA